MSLKFGTDGVRAEAFTVLTTHYVAALGSAAAQVLGVTRATLSTLLNEHSQLSSEMALRIEKAFGVSMDTLMRMQNSYDIAQTRQREGAIKVAPFQRVGRVSEA